MPYLGQDPSGNYYWPDLTKVTGAARSALQLNPAVGTESYTFYAGSSVYNSLQTSLSYSAPKGITGKIAYTWSHSIDDSSSQVSGASFSNSVSGLPAFDLRLDRADSDFDIRNVFSANAVAPLPDIKRGGAYTSILRNWTFNNIFTIRSGIPFTPDHRRRPAWLAWLAAVRTSRTASSTTEAAPTVTTSTTSIPPASPFPQPTPTLQALPALVSAPAAATHSMAQVSSPGPPG